jgi:hypothetical protein
MSASAWSARADLRPWCAMLAERLGRWQPHPALHVDQRAIVAEVERAAGAAEPWLVHPCINALTRLTPESRYERDVRCVTWIAAHATCAVGSITLDRPSWRWAPHAGPIRLRPGHYDLGQCVAHHSQDGECDDPTRPTIAIDALCRSTGFALPRAWPEPLEPTDGFPPLAAMSVREITHALDVFARRLPACAAWASAVSRVIVPLQHDGSERSSGSYPDIPGLIQLAGLHSPVAALEGLVHESAHHHFTMLEAAGGFVDRDHRDLHPSPLRSEPRPLGRVLLAVHALWHMVIFYDDGMASGLFGPEWTDRRCHLEQQLVAGVATVQRGWQHLTRAGRTLIEPWFDTRLLNQLTSR